MPKQNENLEEKEWEVRERCGEIPFEKDWEEKLKKTKFGKNGGSCFECCDYEEMYLEIESFISRLLKDQKKKILKEIENLIAEEMLIANKEGTPTSRLTSLANKINNLNK